MRAHAGEQGRGAAERRKRAEGTRRGRAGRPARTREPGHARGGRYARVWADASKGGDAMHLDSVGRKCLLWYLGCSGAWFVYCCLFLQTSSKFIFVQILKLWAMSGMSGMSGMFGMLCAENLLNILELSGMSGFFQGLESRT